MKKIDKNCILTFVLNGGIAFLAFLPFMIQNGGLLTLSNDFDAQELAFNMFANQSIKDGQIYFNWAIDMGSDFITSFSFYNLGSPFFWISLLFPASLFPYLIAWIFMLKYAVAGITSYLYLRQYVKNKGYAVIGSILYAFCGYQAANLVFYHFHDVVAFFPLLLLGLDYMIRTKKWGRMALAVFINAFINWNFFVGEVLFLIVYYIVRHSVIEQIVNKKYKQLFAQITRCLVEGVLGVGMASTLFIPSVYAMLSNTRVSNHILGSNAISFKTEDYLQFIKALLLPNETLCNQSALNPSNWYSIAAYLPMIGIIFVVSYLICKKDWVSRLLKISLLIALIPLLNNAFVFFNTESYRRWYYMPILIMVLASIRFMDDIPQNLELRRITSKVSLVILGSVFLLVLYLSSYKWSSDRLNAINSPIVFIGYTMVGLLGIVITYLLLKKKWNEKTFFKLFLFSIAFTGYINMTFNIIRYQQNSDFSSSQEVYNEVIRSTTEMPSDIIPYRYAMFEPYYNRNMANSLTSIDSFISTVDNGIFEFYDAIRCHRHTSTMDGPDGTKELLSVKYEVTDELFEGMSPNKIYDNGNRYIFVCENPIALPIGFTYDSYITKQEFDTLEKDILSLVMLRTLVIKDEDEERVSQVLKHYDLAGGLEFTVENKNEDIANHLRESSTNFNHSTTKFSSEIVADNTKYAFFSVAYSPRWFAKVNGDSVDILNINGLMAVPVQQGSNLIEFSYSIILNQICYLLTIISTIIVIILLSGKFLEKKR